MKKRLSIFCALCFTATCAQAQWIRVWSGGESTRHAITDANTIPYTTAGSTLTIDGTSYSTAAIDSITIVNPVIITYSGNTASVDIPETAEGVTAEVNGADVVINNACTNIEHEFLLQGSTTTGSLTYYGEYKTKFHLNGVSITSATGAAIDIQCGKRIDLILEDGTTNSLRCCQWRTARCLQLSGTPRSQRSRNTQHCRQFTPCTTLQRIPLPQEIHRSHQHHQSCI